MDDRCAVAVLPPTAALLLLAVVEMLYKISTKSIASILSRRCVR